MRLRVGEPRLVVGPRNLKRVAHRPVRALHEDRRAEQDVRRVVALLEGPSLARSALVPGDRAQAAVAQIADERPRRRAVSGGAAVHTEAADDLVRASKPQGGGGGADLDAQASGFLEDDLADPVADLDQPAGVRARTRARAVEVDDGQEVSARDRAPRDRALAEGAAGGARADEDAETALRLVQRLDVRERPLPERLACAAHRRRPRRGGDGERADRTGRQRPDQRTSTNELLHPRYPHSLDPRHLLWRPG